MPTDLPTPSTPPTAATDTTPDPPVRPGELPVGLLSRKLLALPGRLGLCPAPGQGIRPSVPPGHRLDPDLTRLRSVYRTDLLISLVEDFELGYLGIADLPERAAFHGLELRRYPIPDRGVPELASTQGLVRDLLARLAQGQNLVIHCWGGRGRTGTLGACVLVAHGLGVAESIAAVREVRPGAVETEGQQAFVREFASAWS